MLGVSLVAARKTAFVQPIQVHDRPECVFKRRSDKHAFPEAVLERQSEGITRLIGEMGFSGTGTD